MRKMKKFLALTSCAAMLVAASVMGTLAYLTSQDTVVNTFTVGKVEIELDEQNVDKKDAGGNDNSTVARDKANKYHLIPGETYIKDPTVTIKAPSEAAYVYMTVTVKGYDKLTAALPNSGETASYYSGRVFLLQNLCDWQADSEWVYKGCKTVGSDMEYRFVYDNTPEDPNAPEPVEKSTTDTKLPALFNKITVPGKYITNDNIDKLAAVEIKVNGYAVQEATFSDYNAAWKAAFGNDTAGFDIN